MSVAERDVRNVLADVVVDALVFTELAGPEELHPDTAAKWLELILSQLRELGASDRLWLYEHVKATAAREAHPERRAALERLADELLEEDA